MNAFFRIVLLAAAICGWTLVPTRAQMTTVIPANLAAGHTGEHATVEGVVAKVFTSKNGNTFLNIGAAYPNQTFTGWIPKDSQLAGDPALSDMVGRTVKITGTIDLYRGKPEIKIMSKDQLASE
jgi:DNA/RNA endonuclease YhcR with UshA esterase domain